MQVDWFVYLKNRNFVVPVKTRGLIPHLIKAQRTFIDAIPIGFQIDNKKKQGGALKLLRALSG
jgi:hypothetical protein